MNAAAYWRALRLAPSLFFKEGALPNYLVFFITHRCTAYCGHCFDWPRRLATRKAAELTLGEIEKVSRSMGEVIFMFLTGGEPFVREDLSEIAKIFYRNNRILKFQIPSNGFFTERTVLELERIAEACPNAHVSTTISIDGLGEEHDRVRGVPGLFEKATRTIREVQKLAKRRKNVGVNAEITVSAANHATLRETFLYLTRELGARNVFTPLVRGEPRKADSLDCDIPSYERLDAMIDDALLGRRDMGYSGFPFARVVTWKDSLSRKIVADIRRNGKPRVPCAAGRDYMILYANGDVEPCEMISRPMGNVRDYGYDFRKLWREKKNRDMVRREIVDKKCFCTHECAMSASLLLDPRQLSRVVVRGLFEDARRSLRARLDSLRRKPRELPRESRALIGTRDGTPDA